MASRKVRLLLLLGGALLHIWTKDSVKPSSVFAVPKAAGGEASEEERSGESEWSIGRQKAAGRLYDLAPWSKEQLRATKVLQDALEVLGPYTADEEPSTRLRILEKLAEVSLKMGRITRALRHFEECRSVDKNMERRHLKEEKLEEFAELYAGRGRLDQALKLRLEALKMRQEALVKWKEQQRTLNGDVWWDARKEHERNLRKSAQRLEELGDLCCETGDFQQAASAYEESMDLRKAFDPFVPTENYGSDPVSDSTDGRRTREKLTKAYLGAGNRTQASQEYELLQAICFAGPVLCALDTSPDDPELATDYALRVLFVAELSPQLGTNNSRLLSLLEWSLAMWERLLEMQGVDVEDLAQAALVFPRGMFVLEAEGQFSRRRHDILNYLDSLEHLERLYGRMEKSERALPLYQKSLPLKRALYKDALQFMEEVYGGVYDDQLDEIYAGVCDRELGDDVSDEDLELLKSRALNFCKEAKEELDKMSALRLYEQSLKLLGPRHPEYAASLQDLATFYEELGFTKFALPLYQESQRLQREVAEVEEGGEVDLADFTSFRALHDAMLDKGPEVKGKMLVASLLSAWHSNKAFMVQERSDFDSPPEFLEQRRQGEAALREAPWPK